MENAGRGVLPQLRLDDLLSELQKRLEAVIATRDRMHGLLEAVIVPPDPAGDANTPVSPPGSHPIR